MTTPYTQIRKRSICRRKGGPVIECAFCLPLVILFMLGTLEITSALFLKETLSIAAYEGARAGVKRGATPQDASDAATEVLTARGITGATVTVTPDDFSDLDALDDIQVLVRAPANNNIYFISDYVTGQNVAAQCTMVREFDD